MWKKNLEQLKLHSSEAKMLLLRCHLNINVVRIDIVYDILLSVNFLLNYIYYTKVKQYGFVNLPKLFQATDTIS